MKYLLFFSLCIFTWGSEIFAQREFGTYTNGIDVLYAETKQINQFFRRFNGEERPDGKRFYPGDTDYRNTNLRKQYLNILFDNSNPSFTPSRKAAFVRKITQNREFLDFHDKKWFAEVRVSFLRNGKKVPVILFLDIQQEEVGSKWVIRRAYVNEFARLFGSPEPDPEAQKFLHPMSHELDFINLAKMFREPDLLEHYAHDRFKEDHLSILLYELKKGNLKFETVDKVKFHFFQIDDWYFEISEFNREGKNRGWLISSLTQVEEQSKNKIRRYIMRMDE